MPPRHAPIHGPAVLFARGGASAHAPADSLEAFRLARRLGATGIATSVAMGASGVPEVGTARRLAGRRGRSSAVSLDEVLSELGGIPVALDVVDVEVVDAVVALAEGYGAVGSLTLGHRDLAVLGDWRTRHPGVGLVLASRAAELSGGVERTVAALRDEGVDALRLPRTEWTAGRVALVHRFGRRAWAEDAPHTRMIVELLHMGIDAVASEHVDRMVDAAAEVS